MQHGASWSALSAGTYELLLTPKLHETTFLSGTYIKAINVFANYELIGFEFTGTNSDIKCVGTCDSSYLKTTIAPGGILNYTDASVTNEKWQSLTDIYGFANITFNFLCTQTLK